MILVMMIFASQRCVLIKLRVYFRVSLLIFMAASSFHYYNIVFTIYMLAFKNQLQGILVPDDQGDSQPKSNPLPR